MNPLWPGNLCQGIFVVADVVVVVVVVAAAAAWAGAGAGAGAGTGARAGVELVEVGAEDELVGIGAPVGAFP